MKKLLLAAGIIAMTATINSVTAQTTVGVKGGVSFTSLSNLPGKSRTTGHAGVFVNSSLNKNWSIQPEVLYSAQGQHFTNEADQKRVMALDYIQVPVMFQYRPVSKVYVEAGPQFGYRINSQTKNNSDGTDKNNVNDLYKKTDVGVNAGLGVDITRHVGIYGRYTQGVMNIARTPDVYRLNSGVQLGAAIKF